MSEKLLTSEIDLSHFEPALFGAMRRLQQAGEVHAKRLARFGGLTPMQLMILRVLEGEGRLTASALSRHVSLSAATLSGMLERLEERGLLLRRRDEEDRRRQWLSISEAGRALLVEAPSLLPPTLRAAFAALPEWERHSLTAALLRVAEMCGEAD
ncbi:MarR family winged helix-turn-helix transcriptional regulator [Pseudomonas sp. CAU 1711]|uniref:MarR family winged helix-turn-helix transcriptional regulator n=1 Tax=Pseudomonas sp. CAU 1711 TaxID=3140356 RepID=UPI003260728B